MAEHFRRVDCIEMLATQRVLTPAGDVVVMNSVKSFGAVGDGVHDDTAAIQAAIDAAFAVGGGIVVFPVSVTSYKCNVTLKTNVVLEGCLHRFFSFESTGVILEDASGGATPVITIAAGAKYWGVRYLRLEGTGSGVADRGISETTSLRGTIEWVACHNFGEEGIRLADGNSGEINHVQVVNCLLNRTRIVHSGAVYIGGNDVGIYYCEFTPSTSVEDDLISANQYVNALVLNGSNTWIAKTTLEISDSGLYIGPTSNANIIIGCRFEFNYGHGAIIDGNATFVGCKADTNGLAADNTYDGFRVNAINNRFIGCRVGTTLGWHTPNFYHKYGFNDTVSSDTGKSHYVGNYIINWGTAPYANSAGAGAGITVGDHPAVAIADATATPNVGGFSSIYLTGATPTTITSFLNGVNGQHLYIFSTGVHTIQHNAAPIYTMSGVNELLEGNKIYHFINQGGLWFELGLPKNGKFNGTLQVVTVPIYINNAAAVAAGLQVGSFYRTNADPDPVCVVH